MSQIYATWLADVLRAEGLEVVEHAGWKTRGRPASTGDFTPRGVIWHHDGSDEGDTPGEPGYIILGRPDEGEPGPLAQTWVNRPGEWHVLAAGRCNHAGLGEGWGLFPKNEGNTFAIGVETDHTTGEDWPASQLTSLQRGTKAILAKLGARPGNSFCGHKEYAPGRKLDPAGVDMDRQRQIVAALMSGDDGMTPEDIWNYGIARLSDGKKFKASTFLTTIHARVNAIQSTVAGQGKVLDELASRAGLTPEQVADIIKAGVADAAADIAADLADGPDGGN